MLAQIGSKQKSLFFNIKPTVIDKLISKNKSSIQNSLLYANEESEGSVSEDSEESSSTSRESGLSTRECFRNMAPIRRSEHANVLGSKLASRSQHSVKKGTGRGPGRGRGGGNLRIKAAKKVVENSKKSSTTKRCDQKKTVEESSSIVKVKKTTGGSPIKGSAKRSRVSIKKESTSLVSESISDDESVKPTRGKKSKVEPSNKKSPNKISLNSEIDTLNLINNKSSPRKFPSNIIDRWKSSGLVIRGRGRGRGRGTARRGSLRAERYNTRDSQTGLMRSGKRRKCSDTIIDGMDLLRKKRKVTARIKTEKSECPSDEQSSFVTTSELSFYENDAMNTMKQSDDELVHSRAVVKVEPEETEDTVSAHSRDTNSNVFMKKSAEKNQSKVSTNSSKITTQIKFGQKRFGRGRKRLSLLNKNRSIQPDLSPSIRESDCSLDSDLTDELTNSPKPELKRQRRKWVDGTWVRRSTRSIGKNNDKDEPNTVVEDLLSDDTTGDLTSNSKSSLSVDLTKSESTEFIKDNILILPDKVDCKIEVESEHNDSQKSVIDTPIENCIDVNSELHNSFETESKINTEDINNVSKSVDNDSFTDFTLFLEETPIKNVNSLPEVNAIVPSKLQFDFSPEEEVLHKSDVESSHLNISSTVIQDTNEVRIGAEIKELETETLDKSNCNLNQVDNKAEVIDQNQLSHEQMDNKGGQIIEREHMENFLNNIDKQSTEPNFSDREIISDETIVSLIDSFCQSDSADLSVEEGMPSCNPLDNATADSEIREKQEDQTNENKDDNSTICPPSDETLPEIKLDSGSLEETTTGELLTDLKQDNKAGNIELDSEIDRQTTNKIENFEIKSFIDDNDTKMDIENADKAMESTEESSCSDSNSNLSEVVSLSVESNSEVAENKCDHSNAGSFESSQVTETKIVTETPVNEAESCPKSQDGNYFASVGRDTDNKERATDEVIVESKPSRKSSVEGNTEEMPSKELLSALGLKSLHCASEDKPKWPNDSYTGTLKAVIKLSRSSDKRGRKMIFKQGDKLMEDMDGGGDRLEYRIRSAEELSTERVPLTHLADIPANRKTQMKVKSQFDLSNSPNIVGASGSMDTPNSSDTSKETGGKQNLIIPEKSSSFSIHPERLCTDVCSYCFGKFGSLDTPCHLAQLKNAERQAKILAIEVHLSADSCLCDGCFRYVDRKANCPASQRSRKPAARRGPLAGTVCAVQECLQPARHSVRRKWLIKLKKSIGKKLVIDMDKNPTMPFPLCSQHYYWVDYFTVCGICKKRLTRNHMYALGPEADELNQALSDDGIPVRLSDKLFLCKLCRYYSSLRLKYRDSTNISPNHKPFLNNYRKKILHYHDIPVSDREEEGESVEEENTTSEVPKAKKKKSKTKSMDGNEQKKRNTDKDDKSDPGNEDRSNDQMVDYSFLDKLNVHREETPNPAVEYSSLGEFDGQVGFSNIASLLNPLEAAQGTVYPPDSQNRTRADQPTRIQVKFGNLNIGKLSNLNIGQDSRPASSTTPAPERPPYLPAERDLKMAAEFEFHGALNSNSSWERLTSTIQFDRDTKKLWQELQRPYGSQSSFLRHLVILEKHWRNGSLVFSENPNPKAVKYLNSVRNRVQAYDGAKGSDATVDRSRPPEVKLNVASPPPRPMSTPVKVASAPPPLMKIAPGSTPWLHPLDQMRRPPPYSRAACPIVATPPPPYAARSTLKLFRTTAPATPLHHRPSMSYQQFKKIRLERPAPVASTSRITVVPKSEPAVDNHSTSTSTSDFVPMICDVRSLATSTRTSETDWNESFRKQQQKLLNQKYFAPILPKIPNSLTVMTFPQNSSVVMKTSSLTIEKAPVVSTKPSIAPPEKPSISVFRETTPSEKG